MSSGGCKVHMIEIKVPISATVNFALDLAPAGSGACADT